MPDTQALGEVERPTAILYRLGVVLDLVLRALGGEGGNADAWAPWRQVRAIFCDADLPERLDRAECRMREANSTNGGPASPLSAHNDNVEREALVDSELMRVAMQVIGGNASKDTGAGVDTDLKGNSTRPICVVPDFEFDHVVSATQSLAAGSLCEWVVGVITRWCALNTPRKGQQDSHVANSEPDETQDDEYLDDFEGAKNDQGDIVRSTSLAQQPRESSLGKHSGRDKLVRTKAHVKRCEDGLRLLRAERDQIKQLEARKKASLTRRLRRAARRARRRAEAHALAKAEAKAAREGAIARKQAEMAREAQREKARKERIAEAARDRVAAWAERQAAERAEAQAAKAAADVRLEQQEDEARKNAEKARREQRRAREARRAVTQRRAREAGEAEVARAAAQAKKTAQDVLAIQRQEDTKRTRDEERREQRAYAARQHAQTVAAQTAEERVKREEADKRMYESGVQRLKDDIRAERKAAQARAERAARARERARVSSQASGFR